MGEREREQRATRPEATAAGASMAGPRHEQLTSLAAAANATAPVQRLKSLSAQLNAAHANVAPPAQRAAAPPQPNRTGLPDRLKEGVEAMSGLSMDDVRVHHNSSQPAQLNAHAFAQGRDIHLAPGQERHLPHEAWHVVQQAQGRVRPTTQLKRAVSINDDATLEHEADVMGARASAGAGSPAPLADAPQPVVGHPAQLRRDQPPVQLKVDPVIAPVAEPKAPSFVQALENPANAGIFVSIDWHGYAVAIYDTLETARLTLSDDVEGKEEISRRDEITAALAALEAQADEIVTRANVQVRLFDQTPAGSGRIRIGEKIHEERMALIFLLAEIQEKYRIAEGSFGAKGRATAIDNVSIRQDYAGAKVPDNKFLKNITIGGTALTDRHSVIKPAVAPARGAMVLLVGGRTQVGVPPDHYVDPLTAPRVRQSVDPIRRFTAVARNGGQAVNMGGTNARGYAWATNTPGWDTTQWEWLHIRGASLGGATGATNLVLGTRDSNTHMIPFESNLKVLAGYAAKHDQFSGVSAVWTIANALHPHAYSEITIAWTLHAADGSRVSDGQATFSPLESGGSALSKDEVAFLEEALRDADPAEVRSKKRADRGFSGNKEGKPGRKKPKR